MVLDLLLVGRRLLAGIVSGILGCLLMLYSVHITPEIIVDFRNIPIKIMVVHAAFPSAIVASLVIGLFRIAYFGVLVS